MGGIVLGAELDVVTVERFSSDLVYDTTAYSAPIDEDPIGVILEMGFEHFIR